MSSLLEQIPEEHREFVVEHRGYLYASLDFEHPESTTRGPQGLPAPRALPQGWEVSPDGVDAWEVIRLHPWGTATMVTATGAAYTTKLWPTGGSKLGNGELKVTNGDHYGPRRNLPSRPSRVLMRYPRLSKVEPDGDTQPFEYSMMNLAPPAVVEPIYEVRDNPAGGTRRERCRVEMAKPPVAWAPITAEAVTERHARSAPGMFYGLEFPWTEAMLLESGPAWLTKAFHAAGTISLSNRVERLTPRKAPGSNDRNLFFEVEYKDPDRSLHVHLFAKFPFGMTAKTKTDRLGGSVAKQPSDFCMINAARLLESALPTKMPRYYFGDISNQTSNWILITEQVQFASANGSGPVPPPEGAPRRGPLKTLQVEEPYERCRDWNLRSEASEYYYLLISAGAKTAGMHKAGVLGDPEVLGKSFEGTEDRTEESYGMRPDISGKPTKDVTGKLEVAINFISDTGKIMFPAYVTAASFKNKLKTAMMTLNAYKAELDYWRHATGDYVALAPQNLTTDNAYFWRGADGRLDLGVLDWSGTGATSLGKKLWYWLYCAEFDDLKANLNGYLDSFVAEYHKHGGPLIDKEVLRQQFIVTAMEQMQGLIAAVPQILRLIPRKEWATIRGPQDPRILDRIDGKNTLQLYLHVMCSTVRIIEELEGLEALERWVKDTYCAEWGKSPKDGDWILGAV